MQAESIETIDPGRSRAFARCEFGEIRYFGPATYECRVVLVPEEEGGFSAHCSRLPGVASQGGTKDEALENIEEAFRGVVTSYIEHGKDIPWEDAQIEVPTGISCEERWIIVDVRDSVT